jgi:hypothetical protein
VVPYDGIHPFSFFNGRLVLFHLSASVSMIFIRTGHNYDEIICKYLSGSGLGFSSKKIKTARHNDGRPKDGPAIRQISKKEKPKNRSPDE